MEENWPVWAGAVVVVIAILAVVGIVRQRRPAPAMIATPGPALAPCAEITELVEFTEAGRFWFGLLLLFNLVALASSILIGRTVLQEIVLVLGWIGNNLVLGIGVIIGRRRRFIVHQHHALTVMVPQPPAAYGGR